MIKFKDVNVDFENYPVLRNISFELAKGGFLNIIGPNGSGKTTLIKILLGLIEPSSGEVQISTAKIGYLPQIIKVNADFPTTVEEVIYSGFNKQYLRMLPEQKKLINKWLEIMEISSLAKHQFGDLSGGERQRVLLIRAVIGEPELLVLDEPTSALDPNFRKKFNSIINKLHEQGTTIINITHDLRENDLTDGALIMYLDRSIKCFGDYAHYLAECQMEAHHHV